MIFTDVLPVFGSRGAMKLEYFEDLVDLTIPAEQRFLLDELGEDAAYCPDIHTQTVLSLTQ